MSLELTLKEPQINLGPANPNDQVTYEFYNYRLDADHLMLYREGQELSLTPKQVETLLALVEKNGEIVSKDALMERLWGETAVEEANLIQNIHFLRKELGTAPDGRPMIETLRRRGYRFTADLTMSQNGVVTTRETRPGKGEAVPWFQQRPVAVTLAIVGLLGLAIIASSFLFSSSSTPTTGRTQFAVLPLKPIDPAIRSDFSEMGVVESLINRLNSVQGFVARPLSAIRNYDALDQDPVAAGREQKVDYVLNPNYQIANGKIRVTAQLINVRSGAIEDTYQIDTAAGELFALQDAVANEIAKKLTTRFDRPAATTAAKRGTTNEEAYRLYLQGKNLTMIRNRDYGKKAAEYFEQAIRLDPNFALAYAMLASTNKRENAIELINKALELDPDLSQAYVARAEINLNPGWNFPAVEKDLAKAIALEPNNAHAHWLSALVSAYRGHFDEAVSRIDTARSIDPSAIMYMFHRGRILFYARRYDEARIQYQQAMDLDDRHMQPYAWMGRLFERQGDHATGYELFLKKEERSPRKDRIDVYRKAYETDGWMGVRRMFAESADGDGYFDLAVLLALNGDKNGAFENLNKAVENREWLVLSLNVEPGLDNLRGDPRFEELLARVGIR